MAIQAIARRICSLNALSTAIPSATAWSSISEPPGVFSSISFECCAAAAAPFYGPDRHRVKALDMTNLKAFETG